MAGTTLRIVHTTGYRYDGRGARSSYNEARMTPVSSPEQTVLHSRLKITPTPWELPYTDYWGTQVTGFEVHERHTELQIVATSTVVVDRPQPLAAVSSSPDGAGDDGAGDDGIRWEQLRSAAKTSELNECLDLTPRVEPGDELRDRVDQVTASATTPRQAAMALARLIHDEVRYDAEATVVQTRAREAWAARAGVCQDISHLLIGALRCAGIPARYVSGYVLPTQEVTRGEVYVGQSHAWVEIYDGQWLGWDPTNDRAPGNHHVVVGRGRDYGDVPPLTGIYTGAGSSEPFVTVELTVLD